jgi:hypothetical protein
MACFKSILRLKVIKKTCLWTKKISVIKQICGASKNSGGTLGFPSTWVGFCLVVHSTSPAEPEAIPESRGTARESSPRATYQV